MKRIATIVLFLLGAMSAMAQEWKNIRIIGIGASGQLLRMNSGATGMEWYTLDAAPASGSSSYINNTTSPQTADFNITGGGRLGGGLGVGTTVAPSSAKLYVSSTTLPQLRTEYATGNRMDITTGSTGSTTFSLTGTTPIFTFDKSINITGNGTFTDAVTAFDVTGQSTVTANSTLTAGQQLVALGGVRFFSIRTVTANSTLTVSDHLIIANNTSGAITLTLPPGNTAVQGREFIVKKITGSSLDVVIDADGAETIDGNPTYTLTSLNNVVKIIYHTGGAWYVIGH